MPWRILLIIALLCSLSPFAGGRVCLAENIVFLRGESLWTAQTNGLLQRQLGTFKEPTATALSPDGAMAAVTAGRDDATGLSFLYLLPTRDYSDGTRDRDRVKRIFIPGVPGVCCPSFAPDGDSLLLVAAQDVRHNHMENLTFATMGVSRVSLSGVLEERLLRAEDSILDAGYVYSAPAFSPDGKLFAVQHSGSDVSGGFSIYTMEGEQVFEYPLEPEDYRPYWAPQFLADGITILCWSPSIDSLGKDEIFLVNMEDGSRKFVTQGSRPTLVEGGQAIVFERCASPWSAGTCDLWHQALAPGASASRILTDAHSPSGRQPVR